MNWGLAETTSFLFGTRWWRVWYGILWAATAPALMLLVWLARAENAGEHPGTVSTAQALGMILFAAILPVTGILLTLGREASGISAWLQGIGLLVALWLAGGCFIFYFWWHIDTLKMVGDERTRHIFGMAATALVLHAFNLYATWRFRNRP